MNKVILMGRLTRDPEVRYTASQMAVANYTLAVDRRRRSDSQEQQADFIRCTAFGKGAEFAEKYLHKGTKIAVSGRIQTGSYTNQEGQTVYTTDVIVDDQEFAESKAASAGAAQAAPQQQAQAPAQQQQGAPAYNQAPAYGGAPAYGAPNGGGFMSIPDGIDEELPFN